MLLVDAVNRLAIAINYFYHFLLYPEHTVPPKLPGYTTIVINLWPSHILLLIEVVIILLFVRNILTTKTILEGSGS